LISWWRTGTLPGDIFISTTWAVLWVARIDGITIVINFTEVSSCLTINTLLNSNWIVRCISNTILTLTTYNIRCILRTWIRL
jgi:hypothetical protein